MGPFQKVCAMFITVTFYFLLVSCGGASNSADIVIRKNLAGELRDNKLYSAAIEEFLKVLDMDNIQTTERANINYLIARIYFEDLQNYEQAAAYYIRAKTLNPDASFEAEASRNLITSMERMGRMNDAKRQLDQMTGVDNAPPTKGDVPIARVGGVPIWLSEVEKQIQSLPPEVQKQFQNVTAKREFARQYVGTELLYHAAVRENMANDPDVKSREKMILKSMLVEKYLLEKVIPEIKIDSLDVKNYFKANHPRYGDRPYDSVKAQVILDYQNEKTQLAFSDYISKLAAIEKVEFLDHNIK